MSEQSRENLKRLLGRNHQVDPANSNKDLLLYSDLVISTGIAVSSIEDLRSLSSIDNGIASTIGYSSPYDGGEGLWVWDSGSVAADNSGTVIAVDGLSTGRWRRVHNGIVSVKWFGAKGDGSTNDYTSIQAACDFIGTNGGTLIFPATSDSYYLEEEVTITGPGQSPISVLGYGATITTSGAIAGFKIKGGNTTAGTSIFGLRVSHRNNNDATYGFYIEGAWNTKLYDVVVEANSSKANYAAIKVGNTDETDASTGSFWTRIVNPFIRKRGGADPNNIPVGIRISDSCNATTVHGGVIGNTDIGILVGPTEGQTYMANAVLVDGCSIEGYGSGIVVSGAPTSNIAGHRFINNRFENGDTVISYIGTTSQPSVYPFLAGNFMVSNAGTYLENPESLYINSMDMSITPDITGEGCTWKQATKIISEDGAAMPLYIVPVGGGRGIAIRNSADTTTVLGMYWTGIGNGAAINGAAGGIPNLQIAGAKSISNTSTYGENLRGTITLSAGSGDVTFSTAEPDASYFVALGGDATESFAWANKSTSGFSIVSSNASSTANVDWMLIR